MTIDTTPKSPLDGLISCGLCGATMDYEAPTQDREASYACRNSHTNGGEDGPLRVETHTTDREIIRTVLEAILTERGNSILASTIRDLGDQDITGLNFPLEDISLLKEDPYFFLQAVKGIEKPGTSWAGSSPASDSPPENAQEHGSGTSPEDLLRDARHTGRYDGDF